MRVRLLQIRLKVARSLSWFAVFSKGRRVDLIVAATFAVIFAIVVGIAWDRYIKHQEQVSQQQARLKDEQERARVIERIQSSLAIIVERDPSNKENTVGLGIFVSADGRLITSYHVVKAANTFAKSIKTHARYSYVAPVSYDAQHNLAVLQFDAAGIPHVNLGDSDKVSKGETAYALLGLETRLFPGKVGERKSSAGPHGEIIEFAAATQVPSSNGSLFDANGNAVGIFSTAFMTSLAPQMASSLWAFSLNPLRSAILGAQAAPPNKDPDLLYSRGVLAENKGNYAEAIRFFNEAVRLNPRYVDAYIELGTIAYLQNRFRDELDAYKKAAEAAPTNVDALSFLAGAYESNSLYNEAVNAHRRVLAIDPKYKDSLYQLGILYMVQGKQQEASAVTARLTEVDPGSGRELAVLLGRMR